MSKEYLNPAARQPFIFTCYLLRCSRIELKFSARKLAQSYFVMARMTIQEHSPTRREALGLGGSDLEARTWKLALGTNAESGSLYVAWQKSPPLGTRELMSKGIETFLKLVRDFREDLQDRYFWRANIIRDV
jgi:hypothetical protein